MNSRPDPHNSNQPAWSSRSINATSAELERWCAAIDGDVAWFDSAIGHHERGQRSMLVLETIPMLRSEDDRFAILDVEGRVTDRVAADQLWRSLDQRLRDDRDGSDLRGYPGGVVGYASYEAAQICDRALPHAPHAVPPLNWSYVLAAVVLDGNVARLVTRSGKGSDASARLERWLMFLKQVSNDEAGAAHQTGSTIEEDLTLAADQSFDSFSNDIHSIMNAIRDGRYYQACLTYPVVFARPERGLLDLYRRIRSRSPGDYGGYFRWDDLELACTSPEEFLSFRGRVVRARPMKGTRRRERGREAEQIEELRTSDKDRAENVMIVDLLRNDLGRSAVEGSVKVERLCEVETYETVLQMTSTVAATLRPGVGVFEAFGRAFPPGSMTGAPKIEACHHLAELEARPRGLYAGSVGWVGYDEHAVFNVIIRSFQAWGGFMAWHTGGGIVADSDAQSEWDETRTKASPALSLLGSAPNKSA